MFVTQQEIAARLASDENLLNLLTSSMVDERRDETDSNEVIEKEPLQEPNDEPASVNSSHFSRDERSESSEDIKLQRILDEALSNQTTGSGRYGSGRPKDAPNRSTEQRADIALMGTVLGNNLAADILGVSTASPSLHSRGLVSQNAEVDFELDRTVKRKLHKIRNKSADALIKVLDMADTNEMYEQLKTAKDVVFVANQLANVVSKVNPTEPEAKPTAQFVIIQPTVRSIEQYETINV